MQPVLVNALALVQQHRDHAAAEARRHEIQQARLTQGRQHQAHFAGACVGAPRHEGPVAFVEQQGDLHGVRGSDYQIGVAILVDVADGYGECPFRVRDARRCAERSPSRS